MAEYAGNHLHHKICNHPSYNGNTADAIRKGFLALDDDMLGGELFFVIKNILIFFLN